MHKNKFWLFFFIYIYFIEKVEASSNQGELSQTSQGSNPPFYTLCTTFCNVVPFTCKKKIIYFVFFFSSKYNLVFRLIAPVLHPMSLSWTEMHKHDVELNCWNRLTLKTIVSLQQPWSEWNETQWHEWTRFFFPSFYNEINIRLKSHYDGRREPRLHPF